MNFLETLPQGLVPNNPPWNQYELETQIQFMDELKRLGVLEAASPEEPIVNTCPLFTIAKAGQPGQ